MRLIDAEALKTHYSWLDTDTTPTKKDIDDIVDAQPSVDAVPVVRCKDCRFLGGENLGLHDCDHYRGPMRVELDDFCSYGERKDSDRNDD